MNKLGYIDSQGKYHPGSDKPMPHAVNPEARLGRQEMERHQYAREILQPRKNGKPSPEFIRAYKDEGISDLYFTQEEIDKADRSLE